MAVFDIFLSHNSADKPAVEDIALKLKSAGVEPWLDKWYLIPGNTFQTDVVFFGVLIFTASGLVTVAILDRFERRFENWRPKVGAAL